MGSTAPSFLLSPSLLYCSQNNKQAEANTRMASTYSRQNGLSQVTIDAWDRLGENPRHTQDRRMFYLHYLSDVVPFEVSVIHIPNHQQPYDITGEARDFREEIQLEWARKIFMTGVISLDDHTPYRAETAAGALAYYHWSDGYCVPDRDQAWGMFTGTNKIRFCRSRDGREWERVASFHPTDDVRSVVAYIRNEYERIRRQYQV